LTKDSRNQLGNIYVLATVITCLSGFGIFQHGGFGKPHVLGIITLVVLAVAWVAGNSALFIVFLIGAALQVRALRAKHADIARPDLVPGAPG
jgi:cytochrome b subunit of formate dehydrogenase